MKLASKGIKARVRGRKKRPYSIWRKMERKSVSFEQLSDIFGFRIIVDTVDACYRALGVVHTTWPMVPGRYKDYISTPKQNDYRSIHTTVIGPGSQRVELQIRTRQMDEIAEYGIAAHALYKDGGTDTSRLAGESRAYQWLRRTIDLLAEGDNPEEFLEHTKLELFHDQVFCFTPKGRLIALPRGATPIDFAYAVHTDVGNTAVGCKINGRMAPLLTELQNGDEVEIVRADGQTPPAAWESLVVTGKARAAIRRATRSAVRKQYAGLGRQILERAFERAGKSLNADKLKAALPRLARHTVDDVMAAVGRGEMFSGDVVKAVYPEYKDERRPAAAGANGAGWVSAKDPNVKVKLPNGEDESAIPIRGLSADLPVRFAPNGGAVPGDRIVGILTPGEGVTIYPDPVAGARRLRQRARPLARCALGGRSRRSAALPGAHRAAVDQRARHARPDRPGHRRPRRQHRQRLDEAAHPGLHQHHDRPHGLGPEAPQRHHQRAAREARDQPRRARDRLRLRRLFPGPMTGSERRSTQVYCPPSTT